MESLSSNGMEIPMVTLRNEIVDLARPSESRSAFRPSDIALSLSRIPRYGGQTPPAVEWSVLQHSLLCYRMAVENNERGGAAMIALLHDSAEAFVGDVPSPQKSRMYIVFAGKLVSFDLFERELLGQIIGTISDSWIFSWRNGAKFYDRRAYKVEVCSFFDCRTWGAFGVDDYKATKEDHSSLCDLLSKSRNELVAEFCLSCEAEKKSMEGTNGFA